VHLHSAEETRLFEPFQAFLNHKKTHVKPVSQAEHKKQPKTQKTLRGRGDNFTARVDQLFLAGNAYINYVNNRY
jgi:hypothetical protein